MINEETVALRQKKDGRYFKECPNCGKEVFFSCRKSCKKSVKENNFCPSCRCLKRDPICYEKTSQALKGRPKSKEHKQKLREANLGKKASQATRDKISNRVKGSGNPMYGKNVYDVWVKKYGKEIADEKQQKINIIRSQNALGKNNSMYGKPSPHGSGNGWSGWYKEQYFRSLKELSYMKYLNDNNIEFRTAETNEFSVKYFDGGQERTYFPDFYLIETDKIVEIKPVRCKKFIKNKVKELAAKEKYGDRYLVLCEEDFPQLNDEQIKQMYENKDIIFIDKYKQKMKDKINEGSKSKNRKLI